MAKKSVPVSRTGRETGTDVGRSMYPFAALREEMNRLFDDFFGEPFFAPLVREFPQSVFGRAVGAISPRVDITETEKAITLTAELPGMDENDVELVLADGMLTIKGEKKYDREEKEENVYVMERSYGTFRRSFRIPDSVDTDKIEARFDKGVLTVTMPRRPEARKAEKRIKIKKK